MSAPLAGCHNKPRPTTESSYLAQDGYETWHAYKSVDGLDYRLDEPTRVPAMVRVNFRMESDCQYDMSATASCCTGCMHAKKGSP